MPIGDFLTPVDYGSALSQDLAPDLARRDLERRLGMLQIQQGETQIAAEQAKATEQAAFKTDLIGLGASPSPDKLRMIATRYPAFAKNLSDLAGGIEEGQRRQTVGHLAQVQAALSNKRPDLAKALVQRHIDADKAAGREPDENDTELVSLIDSGNPDAVRLANATVYGLLAAANPDTAAKNITEQSGDFTLGPGAKRFSADGEMVAEAPFAPQYRSVGEGDTLVEVGGEGGGQASGGVGGGSGSGAPRSVRNNNPGNLKASAFTRKLPGFAGVDSGGFAIFDSPTSGAGAQSSLLSNYIDRGFNTVGKIINRWAPPGDNNDTGAYVRTVAQSLGVKPGEVIGKDKIPALQSIIAKVEGGPGSSNAGTGNAGGARVIAQGAPKQKDAPSGYQWTDAGTLRAIPGGPGDKRYGGDRKAETDLRKEFDGKPEVKKFNAVRPQFQALRALADKKNPSPQDDISLIFTFMKALDPDSVVREGEFATAQNAGSVPSNVLNMYNKAREGTRLNPKQRKAMVATAYASYKPMREAYNRAADSFRQYADGYGVNPDRIARRYAPDQVEGPIKARSVQEARKLPSGSVFIGPNGKKYRVR